MDAPNKVYVEVCDDGIFAFPKPPFYESVEYIRADLVEQPLQQEQPEVDLEKSRNLIRDTLNGVTRLGSLCDDQTIEHAVDNLIDKLGLNARKEE